MTGDIDSDEVVLYGDNDTDDEQHTSAREVTHYARTGDFVVTLTDGTKLVRESYRYTGFDAGSSVDVNRVLEEVEN